MLKSKTKPSLFICVTFLLVYRHVLFLKAWTGSWTALFSADICVPEDYNKNKLKVLCGKKASVSEI